MAMQPCTVTLKNMGLVIPAQGSNIIEACAGDSAGSMGTYVRYAVAQTMWHPHRPPVLAIHRPGA